VSAGTARVAGTGIGIVIRTRIGRQKRREALIKLPSS
jgi:hypothetical protein